MPSLEFKGKAFVYAHHLSVPFRELTPDPEMSHPKGGSAPGVDGNLIIHGDNLEALKALLPVYAGKVDCIYIDPPYNTGGDWSYDDRVNSPLMKEWLKRSANPVEKDDLERHDKWLCMMWPRLQILKELLRPQGIIGVSIDDNEVSNLACLMDDVFGADRRLALAPWLAEPSGGKAKSGLRIGHEYLLIYHGGDDSEIAKDEIAIGELNLSDEGGPYQKGRELLKWGAGSHRKDREKMWFAVAGPDGSQVFPIRNDGKEGRWRMGKENPLMRKLVTNPDAAHWEERPFDGGVTVGGASVRWVPYEKIRGENKEQVRAAWLDDHGTNAAGTKELKEIFGSKPFDTPKPTKLLEWFISLHSNEDAIVLDSFAGSGTTAHAVLSLNRQTDTNRSFILVQLSEVILEGRPGYDLGFRDIIDITAERVRRVADGYTFTGTQRTELLREKLNWTKLRNAAALVEKAESVAELEGNGYDEVKIAVDGGALVAMGERQGKEKAPGLGGSFTFCTLGKPMTLDALLGDGLPSFESLAKYVFFTATGRTLAALPPKKERLDGYIGSTDLYRVHLLYEADLAWLASDAAALTETQAERMATQNTERKTVLIFAAAKFLSQRELSRHGLTFCQLPYAIHRLLGE